MPNSTIQFMADGSNIPAFLAAVKSRNNRNHLPMFHPWFINKLIIANAGIGLPHPNDTMQHILSVFPLIERQIIFLQLLRQRGQHNAIDPLSQHGQHAGTMGFKSHRSSGLQLFEDQRHQLFQLILFFSKGIHFHSTSSKNPQCTSPPLPG